MPDRKFSILVVDDDDDVRTVLAETLTEFGYEVEQASSGEAAIAVLDRRDDIGLLITDVRMPGMNGLELAERARQRDARLRIIVISGYFLPQSIDQQFLKKPFRIQELVGAVSKALG